MGSPQSYALKGIRSNRQKIYVVFNKKQLDQKPSCDVVARVDLNQLHSFSVVVICFAKAQHISPWSGFTNHPLTHQKKQPFGCLWMVAGVGFEPTTFGL